MAEYVFLENLFGKMGKDWVTISQTSIGKNDKMFDEMQIQVLEGESKGKKNSTLTLRLFTTTGTKTKSD